MTIFFFEVKYLKKKLILITVLGTIFSVLIYFYTKSDEINIVSLGDGLALGMTPYNIKGYSYNDYLKEEYKKNHKLNKYYEFASTGKTVKELIYEIKDNKTINISNEKIEIQRAINEANILTINIGMDELSEDKITSSIIKEYKEDIEELLSMIKMLNNKKVIVLGLYTIKKQELLNINKINAIIREACLSNKFTFINISSNLNKNEYYFAKDSYYINYLGHKEIYNKISKAI